MPRFIENNAALRDLDRAIARDPNRWRSYLLRAITYQELGRFDSALNDLDSAIVLQPHETELLRPACGYLPPGQRRLRIRTCADYENLTRSTLRPTSGM